MRLTELRLGRKPKASGGRRLALRDEGAYLDLEPPAQQPAANHRQSVPDHERLPPKSSTQAAASTRERTGFDTDAGSRAVECRRGARGRDNKIQARCRIRQLRRSVLESRRRFSSPALRLPPDRAVIQRADFRIDLVTEARASTSPAQLTST